jgi:flagellar biosynthesis protein FliQ
MTPQAAVHIFQQALMTTFWLGFPVLAVAFAAGIAISLVQIITSIQDPTFGTVPRLVIFLFTLLALMPWMLMRITAYTIALFGDLGRYAR